MDVAQLQADLSDVIVLATFWTSLAFLAAVSAFWPWWRHQLGRAMMSIDALLMLAFLPATLRRLFGVPVTSAGFEWFTLAVLALIPVRTAWLGVTIWRVQRQGGRQE